MKSIFFIMLVTIFPFVTFAVNSADPNLSQNRGGSSLVSAPVMPGLTQCDTTKECTGAFQTGSQTGTSGWDRLLPDSGGSSTTNTQPGSGVDGQ